MDFTAKRKFPRRGYRKPIGVLYQGHFWVTTAEEIGEGGVGLNSDRSIPMDSLVVLSLFIPGDKLTSVKAKVRYNTEPRADGTIRIGFQFLNLHFNSKKKIRDYISAKSEAEALTEKTAAARSA